MSFSSNVISIEKQGQVGIVWLDREAKYNALSTELWSAIPGALNALCEDSEIGSIVFTGRGKHFCAGIDLVEDGLSAHKKAKARSAAEANLEQLSNTGKFQAAITAIADCPLPVIAVIKGVCLGAGVDLISACDIRIASACSLFSVRETKLGLVADVGTLQRLPKILNAGHVAELAYTGKDIKADRAEKIGLVNDVYESAEATMEAGIALAREIAANSPMAVRGTKYILRKSENLTEEQSLTLNGMFTLMTSLQSNDLQEGIKAFAERRAPKFTGS
ncbi:enoyl-CoA hydratase-related protein [uncultured Paraglaciecola sp.]|uniref:enoyl-CoA hydratase-related protein n=1 Tax=uncultured Paraglaciecola sp. TaxID=1765024 RepID=UPI002632BDAE|nr:enoyl-CoA hydratase-related protein [uncultured Paraglaciecola sp.]